MLMLTWFGTFKNFMFVIIPHLRWIKIFSFKLYKNSSCVCQNISYYISFYLRQYRWRCSYSNDTVYDSDLVTSCSMGRGPIKLNRQGKVQNQTRCNRWNRCSLGSSFLFHSSLYPPLPSPPKEDINKNAP